MKYSSRLQLAVLHALILGFLLIPNAHAQDDPLWYVETDDGNQFFGAILEDAGSYIRLQTQHLGILTIEKIDIKKMHEIAYDRIVNGQLWQDNPQATRYFWAPNGFGLKPNEGYYQNVWVFFNHLAVGITDNISLGGGLVPLFLFDGAPTPFWITPKVSFPVAGTNNKLNLGAGALYASVIGDDSGGLGLTYGVATFGSRDSNISLGVGMGYADQDWGDYPTFSLSAMVRTGKRGYFITENYLFPDPAGSLGFASMGGRIVGRNMSFDFGLVIPIEGGEVYYAVPWLGVAVPMNQ